MTDDTTTPEDPADLTATELLAGFRDGTLSPVQACEAVLARIEALNPTLNAYLLVDAERALADAARSADRWRRGAPQGLLDGVPVSIKDVLLTEGLPTLRGSRAIDRDQPWTQDSPAVARLREHGAVRIGKTTTPELAWKAVTDSPLTGVTRNPWDPTRTPGGSSGGAAAAVAAGMAPLAVGTDGGGSVRIPASFTGTCTLKPTTGLVPYFPASAFGSLAVVGPITRSVADAALLLDVISRADGRDWAALVPPSTPFTRPTRDDLTGLRIAFSPSLGCPGTFVDGEVAAAVADAAAAFASLGARVEQVDPPITDEVEAFHVLWFAGAARAVAGFPAARRDHVDPALAEIAARGERLSALDHLAATNTRMEMGQRMARFHQDHDLLLTPTVPIVAFEAGREVPVGWPQPRWTSWTPFTYPFNMTQQPAASVPCGFTSAGLPIGLQVIGSRHADALVVAACQAFEQVRPWRHHRPALSTPGPR